MFLVTLGSSSWVGHDPCGRRLSEKRGSTRRTHHPWGRRDLPSGSSNSQTDKTPLSFTGEERVGPYKGPVFPSLGRPFLGPKNFTENTDYPGFKSVHSSLREWTVLTLRVGPRSGSADTLTVVPWEEEDRSQTSRHSTP